MAHKKGQGSSHNGRDSESKRLGVKRADGQFVFNGVFLPREEIIRIIKKKYTVLTIVIKYQVISSKESIFEVNPYSSS